MGQHEAHEGNPIVGAFYGILFSLPIWAIIGLTIWYFGWHHGVH